jgi:large subunit ribosomal protein L15
LDAKFDANTPVTPELMVEHRMVKTGSRVKVLGRGEIKKALQVSAHAFSDSAKQKITSAGGSVIELPLKVRPRKVR